jgi:hypothetical protein
MTDRQIAVNDAISKIIDLCNANNLEYEFTESGTLELWAADVESVLDLRDEYYDTYIAGGF